MTRWLSLRDARETTTPTEATPRARCRAAVPRGMTSATPASPRLPRALDPSDASEHRGVTRWLSRQDRASRAMADRGSLEETRAATPFAPPRAAGIVAAGQSGFDPAPTGAPRDPHRAARVALGKRLRLTREGEAEPSGSRTPFVSMARACSSRSDHSVSRSSGGVEAPRDKKARESKKTPEDVRAALDPRDIDEGVAWLRQCHARLTQIVAASVVARARARVAARGAREAARGAEASRREETSSSARREATSTDADAFLFAAAEPKPLLLARDTAVGPDPDRYGCARLRPFTSERRSFGNGFGNGTGTNPAAYRVGGLGADDKRANDETRETAAALAARARAERLFVATNTTHRYARHTNATSTDAKTFVTSCYSLGVKKKNGNGRLAGSPLRGAAGVIRLREAQTLFRVDRSRVHGLGVFSRAFVPRDTPVMEYIGEVVRRPVADRREEAAERVSQSFSKSSTYMFALDENDADSRVVDATRKGNLARFANHSCAPNCLAKSVVLANERRVVLFTTRDVHRGEELTYDYQFAPEIPERETPCACGAEICRGVINWRGDQNRS